MRLQRSESSELIVYVFHDDSRLAGVISSNKRRNKLQFNTGLPMDKYSLSEEDLHDIAKFMAQIRNGENIGL